jgi:hypothetical protein
LNLKQGFEYGGAGRRLGALRAPLRQWKEQVVLGVGVT